MRPLWIAIAALTSVAVGGPVEIHFTARTDAFRNPGQGWSVADASRWDELEAVVNAGAGYRRYDWKTLEPKEGQYAWEVIDRDLEFYARKGLPFGFRIMCANYHSDGRDCTPQWVFDKGAAYTVYLGQEYALPNGTRSRDKVAPHFDDPVFLSCHCRFIEALAKRYDGDSRLSGVDLGSYGNWGEWHCWELWPKGTDAKQMPHYSEEVRRQYVDVYLQNFKRTPLMFLAGDPEMLAYAAGKGMFRVGLRRDGVGDPNLEWCSTPKYAVAYPEMSDVWKHRPVWFEWWAKCTDFGKKGTWLEGWTIPGPIDWMLTNHVSLVNTTPFDPALCAKALPKIYPDLVKIDLYAGARLVARSAKVSRSGAELAVEIEGANEGVSRIHLPYSAEYILADAAGRTVCRMSSRLDPTSLVPGRFHWSEKLVLPSGKTEGRLRLRLKHSAGKLMDFRWAVKETDASGALDLGHLPQKTDQCFVLGDHGGALSFEDGAVVYDSIRGGSPETYRFGSARLRDGADGDFSLVSGISVERLDHWNSFRLTAQSLAGNCWRVAYSRVQRAPGEHLLLAQQFVNGEKTDETAVPFNRRAFSLVLVRRDGRVEFAWKAEDGRLNTVAEFKSPYAGETSFSFDFDSPKATQSRVKVASVELDAERRPPEAHLPFYEAKRVSCPAIALTDAKGRADADGSVRMASGDRHLYAVRAPVTASGWTLEWKSEGRVRIRAIQLGSAETLKLSDNVQWDDIADSVPEGYAARSCGISPWVLRFNSDIRWPLTHPYTSGLFFFEVSPVGDGEIRFGDFRLVCRSLHDPKPLEPGVGVTEYPVTGKVGAVEIVHTAGYQPKGAADDLAGWLYVYADGTTACAYASLRWTCGVRKQDDVEGGIDPDMTWFGSPGFDWGEVIYESVNEHGTHWNAWYRWRFVNPHPEKNVVKVQMFRLPGDTREYSVRSVTPVVAADCVLSLVEPAKAVLESDETTSVNVYEYRADAGGAMEESRAVCAEKSADVKAVLGNVVLKRKGAFAAGTTSVAVKADANVPAGQVTLTAGMARSCRLSLMPPRRRDEKPLHYTMICSGYDSIADYDRMVRCGYDEAKVHMAWKVASDGTWNADGWDGRVEKLSRAGMTVALRNTFPQDELSDSLKPFYIYRNGTNTEVKGVWSHDTADPFYREKLIDYYAFVGRFAGRHENVVGINANYGQRFPVAYPGSEPSLVWNENRLAKFRDWLREQGKDASTVTGPQAILDDERLLADYARWNEGIASALIDDISAAIRKGSSRPHLTFNVNFHPIENKLSGQTFAEYLRVGMKYGPGSLFHETSERYSLSFVKWLAAARTCGLVYGDECCQNPPSYEQAAMAYMWMGMMQCFESNYCQWWGGRPATENVAQFKAYHRLLQDADYLPDPVCLAHSFETGFAEIGDTLKVPLHARTAHHYALAHFLRELNLNADRYMLDEFPEKDANVTSRLLIDDLVRAMPADFADRIMRFVRAGGVYFASMETDCLNGHAFLKGVGFTDEEIAPPDSNTVLNACDPFPVTERPFGDGKVVLLRKVWDFGWDPGHPEPERRKALEVFSRLGAFEPLVQTAHPCVFATPYRTKDGRGLVSLINISCEDRAVEVSLARTFAGESRPTVLDMGSGRTLDVHLRDGRWFVKVAVGRINTTILRVSR